MVPAPRGDRAGWPLKPAELCVLRDHSMPQDGVETPHSQPEGQEIDYVYLPFVCLSHPPWRRTSRMDPWPQMRNPTEMRFRRRSHCWRAEDSRLLRISIINFLDHLSLVMQTMQRFGPPLSR